MNLRWILCLLLLVSGLLTAGCGSPPPQFRRYSTFIRQVEDQVPKDENGKAFRFSAQQRQDLDEILAALFGTPNDPLIPAVKDVDMTQVMTSGPLMVAAGAVGSDAQGRARGLYREHCAHCHGITGDGAGPTAAFLNPYPRDYRRGTFKFKSTPVGAKPTHADLRKIIVEGIPGTAMPSFLLLPESEIDAVVEYVRYLSVRGEVERNLLSQWAEQNLGPDERLINDPANPSPEKVAVIQDVVAGVVGSWIAAESEALAVAGRPEMTGKELAESIQTGKQLFQGTRANCASCHGVSALGDGQTNLYDKWTEEFITAKADPKLIREFTGLGMLQPRNLKPRNLRMGIFRGGRRPLDIFWRIRNGIDGAQMPAAKIDALSDQEIWHIVNYVQSLPYEPISDPRQNVPEPANAREIR
ncbi:Cytochrome c [Anatilimnocola aggregata]|uniref:Cytochrome c n=1 Tax=Anatilimnocola aggregata TaxID=2528021 RepID=A0A517YN40_9BACT|nr:cytochrome c [Anatilimnocola aggregata]QDU31631.1 Cytochrome c [Anatilimnocola aggregata]